MSRRRAKRSSNRTWGPARSEPTGGSDGAGHGGGFAALVAAVRLRVPAGELSHRPRRLRGRAERRLRPPPVTGNCRPGEWTCNREFLLSCTKDGVWKTDKTCQTASQCDKTAKTCTVCAQAGVRRCNGAQREYCNTSRSGWDSIETCNAADECSPTHCGPCIAGEVQCTGELSQDLQVCNANNRWEAVDTCETATLCARSVSMAMADPTWTPQCLTPSCVAGSPELRGLHALSLPPIAGRLRPHRHLREPRPVRARHRVRQHRGSVCRPVARPQARSAVRVTPSSSGGRSDGLVGSRSVRREHALRLGDRGMRRPCELGMKRCNAGTLEACTAQGMWATEQACATVALCDKAPLDGSAPRCNPPVCAPQGTHCTGAQLEVCNDDRTAFVPLTMCASPALCECTKDGSSCAGGIDALGCGVPVLHAPARLGEMPLRCDPSDPSAKKVEICDASLNGWNLLETCGAEEFCYPADRTAPCQIECPAPLLCDGAELLSCTIKGPPVHQADCATPTLCECAVAGTCPTFPNGCGIPQCGGTLPQHQCDASILQTCQVGRAGRDDQDCGDGALCYPGEAPAFTGGYCAICPTAGVVDCNDDARRKRWLATFRDGQSSPSVDERQQRSRPRTHRSQVDASDMPRCPVCVVSLPASLRQPDTEPARLRCRFVRTRCAKKRSACCRIPASCNVKRRWLFAISPGVLLFQPGSRCCPDMRASGWQWAAVHRAHG